MNYNEFYQSSNRLEPPSGGYQLQPYVSNNILTEPNNFLVDNRIYSSLVEKYTPRQHTYHFSYPKENAYQFNSSYSALPIAPRNQPVIPDYIVEDYNYYTSGVVNSNSNEFLTTQLDPQIISNDSNDEQKRLVDLRKSNKEFFNRNFQITSYIPSLKNNPNSNLNSNRSKSVSYSKKNESYHLDKMSNVKQSTTKASVNALSENRKPINTAADSNIYSIEAKNTKSINPTTSNEVKVKNAVSFENNQSQTNSTSNMANQKATNTSKTTVQPAQNQKATNQPSNTAKTNSNQQASNQQVDKRKPISPTKSNENYNGGVRIAKRELWWKDVGPSQVKIPDPQPFKPENVTPRVDHRNLNYSPTRQGTKVIDSQRLLWNAQPVVDTWGNFNHQPRGLIILNFKINFPCCLLISTCFI